MSYPVSALHRRFDVAVSSDRAWTLLAEIQRWPEWAPHIKSVTVESCGVAKILRPDGTWKGFPTLPRTLPKIPGPQPILANQRLILLEAGIEPGAANFPSGADPHLWVLDDH